MKCFRGTGMDLLLKHRRFFAERHYSGTSSRSQPCAHTQTHTTTHKYQQIYFLSIELMYAGYSLYVRICCIEYVEMPQNIAPSP